MQMLLLIRSNLHQQRDDSVSQAAYPQADRQHKADAVFDVVPSGKRVVRWFWCAHGKQYKRAFGV